MRGGKFVLICLIGIVNNCAFPYYFYKLDEPADAHYFVDTEDGWKISLHNYRPSEIRYKYPVIVCHGLGSNRFSWDLGEKSIGKYLKNKGFDVWLIDLRGSGDSSKPSPFNRYRYDYNFDKYVFYDLKSAINFVKGKTSSEKVFWVGHSMGGMVIYAYMGMVEKESLKAVVTVGSPVDFVLPTLLYKIAHYTRDIVYGMRFFPVRPIAQILSPFGKVPIEEADILVWDSENIEPSVRRRAMANAVDNVSGEVMKEFVMWFIKGDFTTADGIHSYKYALKGVDVPVLFITGARDGLAPPQSVYEAYKLLGTDDKKFVIASKANGFHADYAHTDLIMGRHVEEEIYPLIENWFKEHHR